MHAAVVLIVYTIDRCTLLGSYGVNLEGNTLVLPACIYKQSNLVRIDGVYMLTGCTIHTICIYVIDGLSSTGINGPSEVAVRLLLRILRNLTNDRYKRLNILEGILHSLGDKNLLTALRLREIVCTSIKLSRKDHLQCIVYYSRRTKYKICLVARKLGTTLLVIVSNACARSCNGISVCISYKNKGISSYLRYFKFSTYNVVAKCCRIDCGCKERRSIYAFNMVCTINITYIFRFVMLRTYRRVMRNND